MFAIYLQCKGVKDRPLEAVLLLNGSHTSETNCYMREYDVIWYRPRLFPTAGGARNYAHKTGKTGKRYKVHKYQGPSEPYADIKQAG